MIDSRAESCGTSGPPLGLGTAKCDCELNFAFGEACEMGFFSDEVLFLLISATLTERSDWEMDSAIAMLSWMLCSEASSLWTDGRTRSVDTVVGLFDCVVDAKCTLLLLFEPSLCLGSFEVRDRPLSRARLSSICSLQAWKRRSTSASMSSSVAR